MIDEVIVETPKTDFYLKLASEADMPTVFADFYKQDFTNQVDEVTGEETQILDGEPYMVKNTRDYSIDIVGKIYEPTGNMLTDAEGFEYPEVTEVPGWHVNIRVVGEAVRETVEAIDDQYGINPNKPSRVWI